MAVYYKGIEFQGKKFGKAIEVYKSRRGREIIVHGYGVLRVSNGELQSLRVEEVNRAEIREMFEGIEFLYLERLSILWERFEDRAERLMREWERVGGAVRLLDDETAAMRLQEYLKGTGYGGVELSRIAPSRGVAMVIMRIEKEFQLTESTRKVVMKSSLLGVDLDEVGHKFGEEIKNGLDPREIMQFNGELDREYIVDGKPMHEVEELFHIKDSMEIVEIIHIKRPLLLSDAGIEIYKEYLKENFRYLGVK